MVPALVLGLREVHSCFELACHHCAHRKWGWLVAEQENELEVATLNRNLLKNNFDGCVKDPANLAAMLTVRVCKEQNLVYRSHHRRYLRKQHHVRSFWKKSLHLPLR